MAGRGKASTAGVGNFFKRNTRTKNMYIDGQFKETTIHFKKWNITSIFAVCPPCPVPLHGSPSSFLIRGSHHSEIYVHHFLVFLSTYPYIAGLFSLVLVFNGVKWHTVFWDKFFSLNSIFEIHAC